MITKFEDTNGDGTIVEFKKDSKILSIIMYEEESNCGYEVRLTEENLFSLIGQLLRIQSEIKTSK